MDAAEVAHVGERTESEVGVDEGGAREEEVNAVIDGETPPLGVSVLIGADNGEVLLIVFEEVTTGRAEDDEEEEVEADKL